MLLCTVLRSRMQEVLFTWLLDMLNWMQFSICARRARSQRHGLYLLQATSACEHDAFAQVRISMASGTATPDQRRRMHVLVHMMPPDAWAKPRSARARRGRS